MGFRVLCIILLNLLSGNRPYCFGWFACGGRLAIGWSFCFAFSTFVRAALPGSNGAGVPSICFAKTSFFGGGPISEAGRQPGLGAIWTGASLRANMCTNIIALRQRCDQFYPPTQPGRCRPAHAVSIIAGYAPVAQWIERRPPEPDAGVRVSPGVPGDDCASRVALVSRGTQTRGRRRNEPAHLASGA